MSVKGFGKVEGNGDVDIKLTLKEAVEVVEEMECVLLMLEDKISKFKKIKKGRKEEVLEILKEGKLVSIKDIGDRIGISSRNVSSQLSYLRDDGYMIAKIGRGHGKLKLMVEE